MHGSGSGTTGPRPRNLAQAFGRGVPPVKPESNAPSGRAASARGEAVGVARERTRGLRKRELAPMATGRMSPPARLGYRRPRGGSRGRMRTNKEFPRSGNSIHRRASSAAHERKAPVGLSASSGAWPREPPRGRPRRHQAPPHASPPVVRTKVSNRNLSRHLCRLPYFRITHAMEAGMLLVHKETDGSWWVPRPSKPLRGAQNVLGVFDSHTSPP